MKFALVRNKILQREAWTEERFIDATPRLCICGFCERHPVSCKRHDEFMEAIGKLEVQAPILACRQFEQKADAPDWIDKFVERLCVSS